MQEHYSQKLKKIWANVKVGIFLLMFLSEFLKQVFISHYKRLFWNFVTVLYVPLVRYSLYIRLSDLRPTAKILMRSGLLAFMSSIIPLTSLKCSFCQTYLPWKWLLCKLHQLHKSYRWSSLSISYLDENLNDLSDFIMCFVLLNFIQ